MALLLPSPACPHWPCPQRCPHWPLSPQAPVRWTSLLRGSRGGQGLVAVIRPESRIQAVRSELHPGHRHILNPGGMALSV